MGAGGSVLSRADQGQLRLNDAISYTSAQLLPHSPITGAHVKEGHMRIEDLCAAAVEESDNGAANLLLAHIGGPKSVTAYAPAWATASQGLTATSPA